MTMMPEKERVPLLRVQNLSKLYGRQLGCRDINFELSQGEVIGIVGESGSGKSTVLNCIAGKLPASTGFVFFNSDEGLVDLCRSDEARLRRLTRTQTGFVCQNARDGLRLRISAGGNIGERLMANGMRNYGQIRRIALEWLAKVEIDPARIDDPALTFSGGMQQRLQIAVNLVTGPKIILMDEPTSGLDVSVQARVIDILRKLVIRMKLSMILVTHDLAVARLMCHRLYVMKNGRIIEDGLSDQILDDPREPYTQLLVSSILRP
ncbi:phosphonate C-P lyase system protein PhnK [uncultured Desulfobacter sp.]|uniref:phosphonate C-P lyase system protein PhnK n=1 Tax=uncultured Desulfobacter sp. TaxID=240139 RepID=UPI002AAC1566|nr:phosphonate C-P lyase system protein PhnK [uncultured Desulfobacter sp.]